MRSLLISDLHLSHNDLKRTQVFYDYLANRATWAQSLYILGDFFNYWLGDDAMEPFHYEVALHLKKYTASGRSVFLMYGNRDFCYGKKFSHLTGCQLIEDPYLLNLHDHPMLLMHGDLLCTEDIAYMRYRKFIRHPFILKSLLSTPKSFRKKISGLLQTKSKKVNKKKSLSIMDVSESAVASIMRTHNVKTLIHGHTHRPRIHKISLGDTQEGKRFVLGDWQDDGWEIAIDSRVIQLNKFTIQFPLESFR